MSVCVSVGEFWILWQGISSPCWRCRCRCVSCQPPRRRPEGGRWSALSCSCSGLQHLELEEGSYEWGQRGIRAADNVQQEHETQRQMEGKTERHWEIYRTNNEKTQSCLNETHSLYENARGGGAGLTVFGEHLELSRVDHAAGDLQLDSFSFQALQPGQQSPALRETHDNVSIPAVYPSLYVWFNAVALSFFKCHVCILLLFWSSIHICEWRSCLWPVSYLQ